MKASKIILGLFFLIILTSASESYAQQQFTQTVTAQNRDCNGTCSVITIPELNNNPNAIILITPVITNGGNPTPHPIGAYYMYRNKWSVYYLDQTAIILGTQFNVEYYSAPDSERFAYIIPQSGVPPCIDRAGLNNNPGAQIRFLPTNPPSLGALYNKDDIKIEYDATMLKWCIANINGKPAPSETAYNIVFSTGGSGKQNVPIPSPTFSPSTLTIVPTQKTPTSSSPTPVTVITTINPTQAAGSTLPAGSQPVAGIPTSLPPNGNAGGDLDGTYPNPTVIGLQGRPLSKVSPTVGQILKWNGTEWIPVTDTVAATAPPTVTPTPVTTPTAAPIQTFLKLGSVKTPQISDVPFPLSELNHQINITKKSRLIINATITINNYDSSLGGAIVGSLGVPGGIKIRFEVFINGVSKMFVATPVEAGAFNTATIGTFMIDENPGNYNVEFKVVSVSGLKAGQTFATPNQSSIMIIPL